MTYEKQFKAAFPKATIERQKTNGSFGRVYYLVRKSRCESMYSGSGRTKAEAWASAALRLAGTHSTAQQ
jgi:hypothetical protein